MTAPSINAFDKTARDAVKPLVFIKTSGDDAPVESTGWRVLQVGRSFGADQADWCILEKNLGNVGQRTVHTKLTQNSDFDVDIWIPSAGNFQPDIPVFSGNAVSTKLVANEDGSESLQIRCEVKPCRFGSVVTGYDVYDPLTSGAFTISDDVVFEPIIDGLVENNKSDKERDGGGWLFVDPESVRTTGARSYNTATASEWTLYEALWCLFGLLNPQPEDVGDDDRWVKWLNLDNVPGGPLAVKNIVVPRGAYLPDALDILLKKHGMEWFLHLEANGNEVYRQVKAVTRGEGTGKKLYLQSPEETLQASKSNTNTLNVEYDYGASINKVVVHGAIPRREITVELHRLWPEGDDALTPDELKKSDPESEYNTNEKRAAWRLWGCNEDGSFTNLRSTVQPITTPLNLDGLFDEGYTPRRRVFEPCLTVRPEELNDEDRRSYGFYLEYVTELDGSGQPVWAEVPPEWSWIVRNDMMGIEFTGDTPPAELIDLDNPVDDFYARLRITAVISGDVAMQYEVTTNDSPNTHENVLFLNLADRFIDDQLELTILELKSRFESDESTTYHAITRYDYNAMTTFADAVLNLEKAAAVGGDFQLVGIHHEYELGDLITEIAGRGISLKRSAQSVRSERYPQITQIEFDFQNQTTKLKVEPLDANA